MNTPAGVLSSGFPATTTVEPVPVCSPSLLTLPRRWTKLSTGANLRSKMIALDVCTDLNARRGHKETRGPRCFTPLGAGRLPFKFSDPLALLGHCRRRPLYQIIS